MSELQRCGLPIRGPEGQSNGLARHFQSLSGLAEQWLAVGWPFRSASLADHNERRSSRLLELHARSYSAPFQRLDEPLNIEWRAQQDKTPSNARRIPARP